VREILNALREAGWTVGVHNDYRQQGELKTFWMFTHPTGVFLKTEGLVAEEEKILAELLERATKLIRLATPEAKLTAPSPQQAAPAPTTEQRGVMERCMARIVNGGSKTKDPRSWGEGEMLRYFACLRECVRDMPAPNYTAKDRMNMRRLVGWLKPVRARKLLEFVIFNWPELQEAYGLRGACTVTFVYACRETLLDALDHGIRHGRTAGLEDSDDDRTHRSDFADDGAPRQQRAFG
jgi:hypothetical protein